MVRKIRLYFKKELKDDLISSLSSKQSHYIKNVMRVKQGDIISLFNSNDGEWDARIINHKRDSTEFKIEKISRSQEFENNLWLAFFPNKKDSSRCDDTKNNRIRYSKIYSHIV